MAVSYTHLVDGGNNFFKLLIVMAIAWISGFVISFVMNKKEP